MKTILSQTARGRCASRITRGRPKRRSLSSSAVKRRGAATVEFALVAPFLLMLLFGILEVGRLVMVQQVLTTGSREGARVATIEASSESDVQTAVANYLASSSISGATVTVTPLEAAQPGDPITVTVTVPFENVSWVQSPWFFGDTILTANTLMRREGIR